MPDKPVLIYKLGIDNKETELYEIEYAAKNESYIEGFKLDRVIDSPTTRDILFYQENYYSDPFNCDLIFDIPSNCKEYFEQKVRLFGIDESFFGDLDGIAKNIEFQGFNNSLSSVYQIKWSHSKSLFKRFIERNFIDFFQINQDIIKIDKNVFQFIDDVEFKIENIENASGLPHNMKLVDGYLSFSAVPKCISDLPIFLNYRESHQSKIIKLIEKSLGAIESQEFIRGFIHGVLTFRMRFEISSFGYQPTKIYGVTFKGDCMRDGYVSFMSDGFTRFIDKYNWFLKQIETEDLINLQGASLDSDYFLSLVEKYKGKLTLQA